MKKIDKPLIISMSILVATVTIVINFPTLPEEVDGIFLHNVLNCFQKYI